MPIFDSRVPTPLHRPDWRNAEAYRPHLDYDRVTWAGEWLRRNPDFLADLQQMHGGPVLGTAHLSRWGLCGGYLGDRAQFFWSATCNPLVLTVAAEPATALTDAFDFRRCPLSPVRLRAGEQQDHLLFSDGARHLQLQVVSGEVLSGPVTLRCTLKGRRDFATKPLTMLRLYRLYQHGRLLKCLYPAERRARRWVEMLRAWDGAAAGAGQRDIALVLYGKRAAAEDWDSGYRTRTQRLLRAARQMVGGGYLDLLRRPGEGKAGVTGLEG